MLPTLFKPLTSKSNLGMITYEAAFCTVASVGQAAGTSHVCRITLHSLLPWRKTALLHLWKDLVPICLVAKGIYDLLKSSLKMH